MTQAFAGAAEAGADEMSYVRRHLERLIVPFPVPLLIGSGAICLLSSTPARRGRSG